MTDRRHPSTPCLSMQIDILFALGMVRCAICGDVIKNRTDTEWDHFIEWADGGEHTVDNLRPVHNKASGGCHKRKSAKAETQRHHIKWLETARIEAAAIQPGTQRKPKRQKARWSQGRKLQGRGFPKIHRPMNPNKRKENHVEQ